MGFPRLKRCRTSSSMSSSIEEINEIQYLGLNSKKQKVDNRLSFPSFPEVKQQGYSVSDDGGEKIKGGGGGGVGFSDSSKAARVETLKKRFGRIIVKATEFQVENKRRDYHKVDSVEMQRKKNQILEKKLKEADIVAEAELKMELQWKREAAKKALVELERSVQVDDNATTMKDFTVMLGYPRNCTAYLCNEIGWYGTPVYSKRRTTS